MGFRGNFVTCSCVILVLWIETKAVHCKSDVRNYITWKDMVLDDKRTLPKGGDGSNSGGVRVIVVDKNGRGDSVTVQGAVDMVPVNNARRVKIHILPGIYREKVHVPASKPYISFIGDQHRPSGTLITWHDKASDKDINGANFGTLGSASVTVESEYFCAIGITIQNSVVNPPGGDEGYQGVALRITGDKAMFYKVQILGAQDTLLDETGKHYFLQCFIQGSVDFIFGNARSLYKGCDLSVVGNAYAITAQSRGSSNEDTGFSFVNCRVHGRGTPVYLGRAWGQYSRVIFSKTELDVDVFPEGWSDWGVPSNQKTVLYGEYKCRGRGADRRGRVSWSKALNHKEAKPFLDIHFIDGQQWLRL